MSFSAEIKNELTEIKTKDCCKAALIYGFALFGRSFNSKRICLQTDNEKTAKFYARLIGNFYGVDVNIKTGGGKRLTYIAEVSSEFDRLKILASVDFGIYDGNIYKDYFYRDCCVSSFVRGAFLACGHLTDPDKGYRVDFYIKSESLAKEFVSLLSEHLIQSHISKCSNGYRIYIKRNEMIVNLLAFMGAGSLSLQFIETSVIKSVKNKINRRGNCDTANINKTVMASEKYRKAIKHIMKKQMFDTLPEELKSAAQLRLAHPELSLKELSALSPEAISPSGFNHRLKKIMEIYEGIKN